MAVKFCRPHLLLSFGRLSSTQGGDGDQEGRQEVG